MLLYWLFLLPPQVSFSQIPYKTVIDRSHWQEKVCHQILMFYWVIIMANHLMQIYGCSCCGQKYIRHRRELDTQQWICFFQVVKRAVVMSMLMAGVGGALTVLRILKKDMKLFWNVFPFYCTSWNIFLLKKEKIIESIMDKSAEFWQKLKNLQKITAELLITLMTKLYNSEYIMLWCFHWTSFQAYFLIYLIFKLRKNSLTSYERVIVY